MNELGYSRREVLRSSVGLAGLTLPTFFQARAQGAVAAKAKACIVVYSWGGMSHYESFDPKPDAPSEIRGEFGSIPTATPGVRFCEYIPMMAKHQDKLAIIRSVHHRDGGHGSALYYNLTGHPKAAGKALDRKNWPCLASTMSYFRNPPVGVPRAIRLPHSMYDNGTLIPGQFGGWLGGQYDPVLLPTPAGVPFGGTSRVSGREMKLQPIVKRTRMRQRQVLLKTLEKETGGQAAYDQLDRFRKMAADMLLDSALAEAYDLEGEDPRVRQMYSNHMGGQGMLLARRLVEAGVPVVQVCAGAGDLAGGSGDNWDTHRDHFPKMKKRLLPVFDRTASALLTDLEQRGMLDETLVVFLTEFGRTPKVNGNGGRDHHPGVYSVAMAGGGVRGGVVYGSSDSKGISPGSDGCTPEDVHATVYKAMGIDPKAQLHDVEGRPYQICEGKALGVF